MTFFQKSGPTYLDNFYYDSHPLPRFFRNPAGPIWIIFVLICFSICFKIRGNLSSKCHHYSSINHYNISMYMVTKDYLDIY